MANKFSNKIFIYISAILFILVGCTNTNNNEDIVDAITIVDVTGEVLIPAAPKRVVDLSGNSDVLSILGLEVIGTANSDAYDYTKLPIYLEDALNKAEILGYSMQDTMDIEAVINLNPDLIIISTIQEKMYDQLNSIAPTVMIQLEALDWKEDVRSIGAVFNKLDKANEWLNNYDTKAKKIGSKIKEVYGEESSYLSFLASGGQFFVFDNAGFGDVLYNDMGLSKPNGMPKQSDISLPVVTYEGLVAIESDYIFVITTQQDLTTLVNNPIWVKLPQVIANKIIFLDASPYFNQGYSSIGKNMLLDEIMEMLNETK